MFNITQFFLRLFLFFTIILFIFLIIIYFLLTPSLDSLEEYNQTWIKISAIYLAILPFIYFIINTMKIKLLQDLKELQNYLNELSDKNYKAVVKIKYFREFLEMALRLKNIVKRLHNKEIKKK